MIKATVMRTMWNAGRTQYTVKAEGHAGAGKYGSDIVCAAVSVLMQTLANEVEEAARAGALTLGVVAHGDGWMKVEATPTDSICNTMEAWVEFVQDGLDAIAQSYPDNVQLEMHTVYADTDAPDEDESLDVADGKLNLQLFAEDAAASGSAAAGGDAAGEGTAEITGPELRPAQERLAKRSRPGKAAKAAGNALSPAMSAEGGADAGAPQNGEPSAEKTTGEAQQQEEPKQADPAQKRRAFGQLMRGEYAAEFEEAMQRAAQLAVQSVQENPAVKGLLEALGEAYGIDAGNAENLEALTEAVKSGKVKNDEYYETLAAERGINVKTARELDKMEGELQRANAEKQRAEQMRLAAEHQQRAAAVRAQWEAEAAQLKEKYPAFELDEVLNNPSVADMIRRGIGLEAAYRAAYFDQLMTESTARTAKQVEQGVAARIQQRAQRPAENGAHPGAAAETKVDVAHMTAKQRAELAKRARRGERIVL
nr:MAG TPA: YsxB-like protein [Bacteriophage sp.]